jgi:hypothetical protein
VRIPPTIDPRLVWEICRVRRGQSGGKGSSDRCTTYGKTAAANAAAVGFPEGVNIWLDLEGVLGSVASEEVIRYCNA